MPRSGVVVGGEEAKDGGKVLDKVVISIVVVAIGKMGAVIVRGMSGC